MTTGTHRTPMALLEDRGNRVARAISALESTNTKATPPAAIRGLFAELRSRLDAAESRLLNPPGQLSIREIMERALRGGEEGAVPVPHGATLPSED